MSTNAIDHSVFRFLRYAYFFCGSAFLAFVAYVAANTFLITIFTVDGSSMEPTLHGGEHLVIDEVVYLAANPQVGDVVVVAYAGNPAIRFVKRIEGVPGDTVTVHQGPVVLASGQYYVLGDNRNFSTDSRSYGPIDRSQILGKVVFPVLGRGAQ